MLEKMKMVLSFIVELLFITSKIYPAVRQLATALGEVTKLRPIKKEKSWRDKL